MTLSSERGRIAWSLFLLRVGVFIVMAVWTLDKFVNPGHASGVYETFYMIPGLGSTAMYVIGALEALLVVAFVLGLWKRITYGSVLVLHGISTLSSMPAYLAPFDHLLFFAAWPMLAACVALYLLRDLDTRWVVDL